MAAPNILASPTISTVSSISSFSMLSSRSLSQGTTTSLEDSDDEIVYSVTESSLSSSSNYSSANEHLSDDDFVVLSRPRSRMPTGLSTPKSDDDDDRALTPVVARLTSDLGKIDIKGLGSSGSSSSTPLPKKKNVVDAESNGKKLKRKKAKAGPSSPSDDAAGSYPTPVTSPACPKRAATPLSPSPKQPKVAAKTKTKSKKKRAAKAVGLGARPIVDDDVSEKLSEFGEAASPKPTVYEEAVGYITSFLSNPDARRDSACRLTLLQALIIELGLATSALPASLAAAKAFLKSRVFLNIREYLAVRGQGLAAVQRIMHPSRSSLIKDIRKNGKRAPLGWVKESGLQVLLVQCYHR